VDAFIEAVRHEIDDRSITTDAVAAG